MPRIVIVGGGVAGLTLANGLRRIGIKDFLVVERQPQFTDIGFGVMLNQAAFRALEKINPDLEQRVLRRGSSTMNFEFSDCKGQKLFGFLPPLTDQHRERMKKYGPVLGRMMRRCDLIKELLVDLPSENLLMNTHITEMHKAGPARLTLHTSNTEVPMVDCQLVIGADGAFSNTRFHLYNKPEPEPNTALGRALKRKRLEPKKYHAPSYSGVSVIGFGFRNLPSELESTVKPGHPVGSQLKYYVGPGISGTGFITHCLPTFRGDSLELPPEDREAFSSEKQHWEADVLCVLNKGWKSPNRAERAIMQSLEETIGKTSISDGVETTSEGADPRIFHLLDASSQFPPHLRSLVEKWIETPESERNPLYHWHVPDQSLAGIQWGEGRIALIGDAAHVMPPWGMTSIGLAIEDAYHVAAALDGLQDFDELHGHIDLPGTLEQWRGTRAEILTKDARDRARWYWPRSNIAYLQAKMNKLGMSRVNKEAQWVQMDQTLAFDKPNILLGQKKDDEPPKLRHAKDIQFNPAGPKSYGCEPYGR